MEIEKIKKLIKSMFLENTGSNMLDSGGHYGYGYDKNKLSINHGGLYIRRYV